MSLEQFTIKAQEAVQEAVNTAQRGGQQAVEPIHLLKGAMEKGKDITGYEVQYSLKKSFAGAKTIGIKKAGAVKTVLKGLTPNKTYFVRVRAYKAVGSKKYYSAWSKAKNAKPKK